MKNLLTYEIKKHIKLILGLIIIIFLISLFDNYYVRTNQIYDPNSEISTSAKSFISFFSFAFIRLFLFGLFIYFINDFINNIMQDEKNLLFSIPIKSSQFFLTKIISISILVALVFLTAIIFNFVNLSSILLDFNFQDYIKNGLVNTLKGISSFYSLCLVALLLGYFTILSIKKQLEKTRFIFLWILPFSIAFSVYFAFVQKAFYSMEEFFITPSNWYLVLLNIAISVILFYLNCHWLDKKIDM